ncbi:S-adenosyl-L-methionine-dependent methyltransferase [Fusarium flagelliforme]|uniref:Methyltransferase n=1 Tax=Fusarium flagelliforme TaxID=2675880 RepID=A0A395MYH6_9HYPO|nr:S-adenosyl-L-methionine-dependent methyltransferase [Fusarium flagelliforme]KAH7197284.1 S-adenosyl-L-methionine-dependent methyltransferase [Fusarium flagelliforme]RFN52259.1 hypothetical protein FIE12Z_3470 [Fusarium flagelliforme]
MQDSDSHSFSLISEPGIETIYTPTEQDTDEYDFVFEDGRSVCLQQDDDSSCCTSLAPSMLDYEHSHGRRYHAYLSGRYPLPNDKGEQYRELNDHLLMQQLFDGELFLSDIGDKPKRIIDIGTGTGIWAVDVADLYPDAEVIGTDLSPTQPKSMPPNASMFVEDCEDPYWANGDNFDLVHFRGMAGFLLDLDSMVANAHEHMRDGGWIEFQDFDYTIRCDDGTMKKDDPLRVFFETCARGMRKYGCTNYGKVNVRNALISAGFTKVHVVNKKVPISHWAKDEGLKDIGTLMAANLVDLIGAMAVKPLIALGIPTDERKEMVAQACQSLKNGKAHRYINCRFVFAKKIGSEGCDAESDAES